MSTTTTWNGATGDWNIPGNWSNGVPDLSDVTAVITQGTVTVDSDDTYALNALTLAGPGAVLELDGTLDFSGSTDHGIVINDGTLALGQAGTLLGVPDVTIGTNGTLDISAATEMVETIGGLSDDGTVILGDAALIIGAGDAAGTLSGIIETGTIQEGGEIDKTGTGSLTLDDVVMNPGTNNSGLYISAGSLVENTGSSSVFYLAVGEGAGSTASATLSGGTLAIGGSGSALQLGDYGGTGSFDQTGGLLNITSSLNIGNQGGTGTYAISAGTLALDGDLYVIGRNSGSNAASSGILSISGTGLVDVAASELIIGDNVSSTAGDGSGTIVQTGGTLEIDPGADLYLSAYGNGEYDLEGGTLEAGGTSLNNNYNGHPGTSVFNLAGGTIQVAGSALTTDVNATLAAGTTSVLNLNGLGAGFTGAVTGSGNLDILGAGTAGFTDLDTAGTVTLNGNTLDLSGTDETGALIVTTGGTAALSMASSATLASSGLTLTDGAGLNVTGGSLSVAGTVTNAGALALADVAMSDAEFLNQGEVTLAASVLTVNDVDGTGMIAIGDGSSFNVTGTIGAGQTIRFDGPGGTLSVGEPSEVLATISGFGVSDSIDLTNVAYMADASINLGSGNVLSIVEGDETYTLRLDPVENFTGQSFQLLSADNGNETVVESVLCFLAGTHIVTPLGEVAVESLAIGDQLLTATGEIVPVRWIGIHTVSTRFANLRRTMPIRIKAGALGENLPRRDLLVSPDHAMYLGGILVQAVALVNGTSIIQEMIIPERFVYYHVETANHALILAEGAATETFVDNTDRMAFDNWAEHEALYGNDAAITEMPYPRAKASRQIPVPLRRFLAARAAIQDKTLRSA